MACEVNEQGVLGSSCTPSQYPVNRWRIGRIGHNNAAVDGDPAESRVGEDGSQVMQVVADRGQVSQLGGVVGAGPDQHRIRPSLIRQTHGYLPWASAAGSADVVGGEFVA